MAYVPPHLRGAAAPSAAPVQWQALESGCRCNRGPAGIYPGGAHTLALRPGPLLGNLQQFCAAFYHIEPTPEAGLKELCLAAEHGGGVCPRKTVVCIARLQARAIGADDRPSDGESGWRDVYVCRYSNCFRGDSTSNVHAEKFLTADRDMERHIGALPERGGRLVLYLTYQPCHHSGGHSRAVMGHTTSCTRLLLAYAARVLTPRAISLHVRVPYIYRAHWKPGLFPSKYEPVVAAAVEGLRLLAATPGVDVAALVDADWAFLVSLCDPAVQEQFEAGGGRDPADNAAAQRSAFSPTVRARRASLDTFVARSLQEICRRTVGGDAVEATTSDVVSPCQECEEVPKGPEHDTSEPGPKPESPPSAATIGGMHADGGAVRVRYCRFCAIELGSESFLASHLKGKRHAKLAGSTAADDCWEWRDAQTGQEATRERLDHSTEDAAANGQVPSAAASPPTLVPKSKPFALNPCAPDFTLNPCPRSFTAGDAQYVS